MVRLPPSATSAREARRVVADELAVLNHPELVDDVSIVVTELVVNAVIHARTGIGLTVQTAGAGVRVEVSDGSPVVPRWTPASMSATSGRGLILMQRLSREWGVERHEGGKTVWALIDEPGDPVPESDFEELLALWVDDDEPELTSSPPGSVVQVDLTVDVLRMLDSRAHTEDLVRELQLLVFDEPPSPAPEPVVRLAHRVASATEAFAHARRQMLHQTLTAAQRGHASVDLRLHLHPDDTGAASRWLAAMDEADALTERGVLLLPSFPPELVTFRRDYIAVIVGALAEA